VYTKITYIHGANKKLGAMVLGAPRAANPLASSKKRGGGSIPLAPLYGIGGLLRLSYE